VAVACLGMVAAAVARELSATGSTLPTVIHILFGRQSSTLFKHGFVRQDMPQRLPFLRGTSRVRRPFFLAAPENQKSGFGVAARRAWPSYRRGFRLPSVVTRGETSP